MSALVSNEGHQKGLGQVAQPSCFGDKVLTPSRRILLGVAEIRHFGSDQSQFDCG